MPTIPRRVRRNTKSSPSFFLRPSICSAFVPCQRVTTVLACATTSFHWRLQRSGEDGLSVIEFGDHGQSGLVINDKGDLGNSASPSVVGHPGEALARCELHQVGVRWGSWLCLQRHAFPGVVVLRLEIKKEI